MTEGASTSPRLDLIGFGPVGIRQNVFEQQQQISKSAQRSNMASEHHPMYMSKRTHEAKDQCQYSLKNKIKQRIAWIPLEDKRCLLEMI